MGRHGNVILRARCPMCGLVLGVKHIECLFRKARAKGGVLVTEQTSHGRGRLTRAAELISLSDRDCRRWLDQLDMGALLDALLESFVSLANLLTSSGLISRQQFAELRVRASAESVYRKVGSLVDSGAVREEPVSIRPVAFKPMPVPVDHVSFDNLLSAQFKPQKVTFEEA